MDVVDLSNLREALGGDKELEQEMFDEFISSSKALLQELMQHCSGSNDNESWRKAAHALKGIAVNLGAQHLGELCKNGQESSEQNMDIKKSLLTQIEEEHEKVVGFLQQQTV